MNFAVVLTRVILGLGFVLILFGAIVGFTTVNPPTGSGGTASCGSPWSPRIGSTSGPLTDATVTPEQCSAALIPLGILAALLTGTGITAIIAAPTGFMVVGAIADYHGNGAARVNLGPRRNKPSNPND